MAQKSGNLRFERKIAIMNMTEKMPILLIEDDEVDTEAVMRLFAKYNIEDNLISVSDGFQALDVLNGHNGMDKIPQPCLIFLDINMPGLNGLELLQKIRSDNEMKRNIVFMLTTSARESDIDTAYNLQVAGYFLKANLSELVPLIREYYEINVGP